jgi:apolipoprotein N-acyltransferase
MVVVYGEARLTFLLPGSETVRIHSIIALEDSGSKWITEEMVPLSQSDPGAFRNQTTSINQSYIDGSVREARSGAQIVVWPEVAVLGFPEDIDALIYQGQTVSREENIYLAMSVFIIEPNSGFELRLFVADPNGDIVINHLKYAYGFGDPLNEVALQVVDTPYGRLTGIQCGDMDIPGVVQQAGQKGADILLIPSMENFPGDLAWHYRFTHFRAVENGVSVVRPTAGGISIATDPFGRILASMNHYTTDNRVMVAHVPTKGVSTVYPLIGDLFGWLTVAGFVVIAGWAVFLGRRSRKVQAGSAHI